MLFRFATLPLAAQAPANPLTVENDLRPRPAHRDTARGLTWSPDGKHLTYLDGGELIDLDPGSGKPHVLVSRAKMASLDGAAASEQDRDHRSRYKNGQLSLGAGLDICCSTPTAGSGSTTCATAPALEIGFAGEASGDDPKFSPNGESISFVRNHGLAVVHLRDPGTPTTVVAPAPNETILNGEVDWVYEEELETRSNYFWSPDSKNLAFLQMNEADVPQYPDHRLDSHPRHGGSAALSAARRPQSRRSRRRGQRAGGKTVWVKLPIHPGQDYIPRFGWVDRKTLWIETLTRDQKHRTIYFADAANGEAHPVLEITDDKFLDENYDVSVADGNIVLTNWSDGHNHIYLYSYDEGIPARPPPSSNGNSPRATSKLAKSIASIMRTSWSTMPQTKATRCEQQIWQVSFDGERKQLSTGAGNHQATLRPPAAPSPISSPRA